MESHFRCQRCGAQIPLRPELLGQVVLCPGCLERVYVTDKSQAQAKATSVTPVATAPAPRPIAAATSIGTRQASEKTAPPLPIGPIVGIASAAALAFIAGVVMLSWNRTREGDQQTAQATVTPLPPPASDAQSQQAAPPPPIAADTAPAPPAEPAPAAAERSPATPPASTSANSQQNSRQQPVLAAVPASSAPGSGTAPARGSAPSERWGEVWRLPATTSMSPEKLASIEDAQTDPRITVKSAGADIRPGAAFVVAPEVGQAAWALRYLSPFEPAAGKEPLALLRRDGHDLTFTWATPQNSPQVQRQISNCLLEISAGTLRRVGQLREPLRSKPITLEATKDRQIVSLPIPDPPRLDGLRLEVAALSGFSSGAKFRGDLKTVMAGAPPVSSPPINAPRVNSPPLNAPLMSAPLGNVPAINSPPMNAPLMNAPVVIEFEEIPGAELRIRFVRAAAAGNLEIWIEPAYRNNQGTEFKLTMSELDGLEEQAKKSLPDAQRKLGPAETSLTRKQDEAKKLKANEPPQNDAKRRSNWLAKVREVDGWVKRLDGEASALKSKIAEHQAHRDAVPKLRSLIASMNNNQAIIHYVVYSECGDPDLLLVDGR